eukprot:GHVU01234684.1.p1 GENE.GHVU01234684.1~~GHVU01234684.1.p1  ORF type:complete len:159 (+),score=5.34 GHVU01234684.1:346-822(+)
MYNELAACFWNAAAAAAGCDWTWSWPSSVAALEPIGEETASEEATRGSRGSKADQRASSRLSSFSRYHSYTNTATTTPMTTSLVDGVCATVFRAKAASQSTATPGRNAVLGTGEPSVSLPALPSSWPVQGAGTKSLLVVTNLRYHWTAERSKASATRI